jgi:hypothetical protein
MENLDQTIFHHSGHREETHLFLGELCALCGGIPVFKVRYRAANDAPTAQGSGEYP